MAGVANLEDLLGVRLDEIVRGTQAQRESLGRLGVEVRAVGVGGRLAEREGGVVDAAWRTDSWRIRPPCVQSDI